MVKQKTNEPQPKPQTSTGKRSNSVKMKSEKKTTTSNLFNLQALINKVRKLKRVKLIMMAISLMHLI